MKSQVLKSTALYKNGREITAYLVEKNDCQEISIYKNGILVFTVSTVSTEADFGDYFEKLVTYYREEIIGWM